MRGLNFLECPKCKSRDLFMKKSGNNTGLYCGDCGAWIKWINKNEIRIIQRQIEKSDKELDDLIECLPD